MTLDGPRLSGERGRHDRYATEAPEPLARESMRRADFISARCDDVSSELLHRFRNTTSRRRAAPFARRNTATRVVYYCAYRFHFSRSGDFTPRRAARVRTKENRTSESESRFPTKPPPPPSVFNVNCDIESRFPAQIMYARRSTKRYEALPRIVKKKTIGRATTMTICVNRP